LIDDSSRLTSFARTITNPEASQIARALLKRSAQLVACQIAGVVEFKNPSPSPSPLEGEGRDEEVGMVFNMEGSLFWKGNNYKTIVQETLKQLVPKYNVRFVEIKDSGILGAAKLVS
jgi:hexokinase